ncbi:hypothetical protein OH76DRAFT_1424240, partial [Lentinus brumalis]
ATRIAQSLKKAEQKLEEERVLEVLKSSSAPLRRIRSKSHSKTPSSSASSASGSGGRTITHRRVPSLPPRRTHSPSASTVGGSVRSFEQVANASLSPFRRTTMSAPGISPSSLPPEQRFASPSNSPSRTPPRPLAELPPDPPPMHPDRKASASGGVDVAAVVTGMAGGDGAGSDREDTPGWYPRVRRGNSSYAHLGGYPAAVRLRGSPADNSSLKQSNLEMYWWVLHEGDDAVSTLE